MTLAEALVVVLGTLGCIVLLFLMIPTLRRLIAYLKYREKDDVTTDFAFVLDTNTTATLDFSHGILYDISLVSKKHGAFNAPSQRIRPRCLKFIFIGICTLYYDQEDELLTIVVPGQEKRFFGPINRAFVSRAWAASHTTVDIKANGIVHIVGPGRTVRLTTNTVEEK